jgi:hypothetical protein
MAISKKAFAAAFAKQPGVLAGTGVCGGVPGAPQLAVSPNGHVVTACKVPAGTVLAHAWGTELPWGPLSPQDLCTVLELAKWHSATAAAAPAGPGAPADSPDGVSAPGWTPGGWLHLADAEIGAGAGAAPEEGIGAVPVLTLEPGAAPYGGATPSGAIRAAKTPDVSAVLFPASARDRARRLVAHAAPVLNWGGAGASVGGGTPNHDITPEQRLVEATTGVCAALVPATVVWPFAVLVALARTGLPPNCVVAAALGPAGGLDLALVATRDLGSGVVLVKPSGGSLFGTAGAGALEEQSERMACAALLRARWCLPPTDAKGQPTVLPLVYAAPGWWGPGPSGPILASVVARAAAEWKPVDAETACGIIDAAGGRLRVTLDSLVAVGHGVAAVVTALGVPPEVWATGYGDLVAVAPLVAGGRWSATGPALAFRADPVADQGFAVFHHDHLQEFMGAVARLRAKVEVTGTAPERDRVVTAVQARVVQWCAGHLGVVWNDTKAAAVSRGTTPSLGFVTPGTGAMFVDMTLGQAHWGWVDLPTPFPFTDHALDTDTDTDTA